MKNKEKKTNIRPFTRQFYRQNRWRILLMLLQTVVITAGNLLIAWLLQQILDLVSGVNRRLLRRKYQPVCVGAEQ